LAGTKAFLADPGEKSDELDLGEIFQIYPFRYQTTPSSMR
jgi:hypothetical protein